MMGYVTERPDCARDRCRAALLTLRMIGNSPPNGSAEPYELSGQADPAEMSRQVERATSEVIDSLRTAGSDIGATRTDRTAHFLEYRMRRLRAAADDAVTAARSGSVPVLRRRIVGFDALTDALWQVQSSLQDTESDGRSIV